MSISSDELEKIAQLAYLDTEHSPELSKQINEIMDFVEQLSAVDTKHVAPLFHPLDLHQRLRADVVTEEDCIEQLMNIAPQSEDHYYTVPKVLDLEE